MDAILFAIGFNLFTLIFYPIAMHRAKIGKGPWVLFGIGCGLTVFALARDLLKANINAGTISALVLFAAFTVFAVLLILKRRREYTEDDAE